jgi:hypothetical protein
MANVKISELAAASTALAGTEVLPIVQSSATVKVSVANLTAGRAVSAASLNTTGDVGIGTSSPDARLDVTTIGTASTYIATAVIQDAQYPASGNPTLELNGFIGGNSYRSGVGSIGGQQLAFYTPNTFGVAPTERARIDSSGNLLVGKTSSASGETTVGCILAAVGKGLFTASGDAALIVSRIVDDGNLVLFTQAGTTEGTISVSGTTVSYNGGHLARFTQLTTDVKDESLLKGTVLSNLDEMCVYVNEKTGKTANNEQLNKIKVSDLEGDVNVAGVFVAWIHDEQHNVDEINMAMTGDMIIRIAQGTTVQRGDLLMSAGDGTAKPQGDEMVRSKTIAKVTSTHVTCTYADGSYCVPCVLMAC